MNDLEGALVGAAGAAGNVFEPVFPLAVIVLTVILALVLHSGAYTLAMRLTRGSSGLLRQVLERTRRQMRLAAILLALAVVLPRARFDRFWGDIFGHFALILLIGFVGWMAMTLITYLTGRYTRDLRIDTDDNFRARKVHTQMRLLRRTANIVVFFVAVGAILLTFEGVREYGVSIFASAGAAGLVLGFAARPVLANLIAGVQIALTQPIKIEDVVIVEDEWGWVEEIGATYVVVRLWDWRRMIVPLSYFIEQPFQNWTRETASIIGNVIWHVDYTVPVEAFRTRLEEVVRAHPLWDRQVVNLQVVEATPETLTLRGLMSARTSPAAWDLRCDVREAMIVWLQAEHPGALPRQRAEVVLERTSRDAMG